VVGFLKVLLSLWRLVFVLWNFRPETHRLSHPAHPPNSTAARGIVACLAVAWLVVRWLMPAEAATRGEQLWLAAGWCCIAAAWWWCVPSRRGGTTVDVCVALLIGGHLQGGLVAFFTGGQLRTAANLMGEWVSLGAAWLVLRELLVLTEWAVPLRRAILATAATVALLGVWQHYVELPRLAREMGAKIEQVRAARERGEVSPAEWELAQADVSTTDSGLILFQKRLEDSREPFGFFALANTLGGLLAACFVWTVAAALTARTSPRLWWRVGPVLLVLAWCLALTKSRTAWVGALCGLAVVAVPLARRARQGVTSPINFRWSSRTLLFAPCLVGVLLAAAGWGLSQTGGFDRQVLTEAAKSFSYRWQYWTGAARLIGESPLLGVGLGQFREHYLRVKLPEASEEIADPHNLLLDVWVHGGLCAVAGLLGLLIAVVVRRPQPGSSESRASRHSELPGCGETANGSVEKCVFLSGLAAFALAFAANFGLQGVWDDRYFVLAVAWVGFWSLLRPVAGLPEGGALAALLALTVHLLGAGGLGMPAVVQAAWVWLALGMSHAPAAGTESLWKRRVAATLFAAVGLVIAGPLWQPVLRAERHLQRGDLAAQRGNPSEASTEYLLAKHADRWNPTPLSRLAGQSVHSWQRMTTADANYTASDRSPFSDALTALLEAEHRHPQSTDFPHQRAVLWLALSERSGDAVHARNAAEILAECVARYPTNSEYLAAWSRAAGLAGDAATATQAARRALDQDDLNQRLGHVDRVLPKETRQSLERQPPG
jgi:hypothetical protein